MKYLYTVSLVVAVTLLSACGTTSHQITTDTKYQKPYCNTEQTIITDTDSNGDAVSSKTVVQCSDKSDGMDHPLVKTGVAKECGIFYHPMNIGGQSVWEPGMSCFIGDEATGYWVVVPMPGSHY
jgi:hypothetical protein